MWNLNRFCIFQITFLSFNKFMLESLANIAMRKHDLVKWIHAVRRYILKYISTSFCILNWKSNLSTIYLTIRFCWFDFWIISLCFRFQFYENEVRMTCWIWQASQKLQSMKRYFDLWSKWYWSTLQFGKTRSSTLTEWAEKTGSLSKVPRSCTNLLTQDNCYPALFSVMSTLYDRFLIPAAWSIIWML